MRFHYQTTVLVLKHPLYRCWTSGRIDESSANSDLRQLCSTSGQIPFLMKHEYLNTCNQCFAFFQDITTKPEFDVLVLVSRPRHQDLWSQDRDQDQDLFSQDRDQDQDLFFQDRDQDQDLKIRSRDGLETKTCLETSHHCQLPIVSLSLTPPPWSKILGTPLAPWL